jgi:hypothetical protein
LLTPREVIVSPNARGNGNDIIPAERPLPGPPSYSISLSLLAQLPQLIRPQQEIELENL